MFSLSFLLFQKAAAADEEGATQNLIDIIVGGGPLGIGVVLVLLVLSIIAFAIFIERWLTIKRAGKIGRKRTPTYR